MPVVRRNNFNFVLLVFSLYCIGLSFNPVTYAAGDSSQKVYFQFPQKIIAEKEEVDVDVAYNGELEPSLFVKVFSNKGTAEVYNPTTGKWVLQDTSWDATPKLTKTLKFRVEGIHETDVTLWFEIHNTTNGETVESEKTKIQVSSELDNYIQKINTSLKNRYISVNQVKTVEKLQNSIQESTSSGLLESNNNFNSQYILITVISSIVALLTAVVGLMIKYNNDPIRRFFQKVFPKLVTGNSDDGADLSGFINSGEDDSGTRIE